MKLQNLIIIFLAIALPVILILSIFVELQVETAMIKANYNDYLVSATHETVVAFQINTLNNKYSSVSDTKIRDIEAAINVFSSSLANSFGRTGSSKSYMMAYVPALVFSLYDGYYIYSPTEKDWRTDTAKWQDIPLKHELKSYVYYSKEYKNGDNVLTVNYSLDNYVVVYYKGKDIDGKSVYVSKAGYLEAIPNELNKEKFLNSLGDNTSKKYYIDAWAFTKEFNGIVQRLGDSSVYDKLKIDDNNLALPRVSSNFNDEKHDVIKQKVISNLIPAMSIYGYEMPELTDTDWDLVLNNVCFIAFMQNMPAGTTTYNNYEIAISTENKEMINENDIYFVNTKKDLVNGKVQIVGSYHRIWCQELIANDDNLNIKGYNKTEFKTNEDLKNVHVCYKCMVHATDPKLSYAEEFAKKQDLRYGIDKRRSAYYTALANQKSSLLKSSDFVNGSVRLEY